MELKKLNLENTSKEVLQETRQEFDVWLNKQIHDNDFLIATLAAFVLGTIGYTLRRVPYVIFDFLRRRLTCTLTINNDINHIQYDAINVYLLAIYRSWWSKNYLIRSDDEYRYDSYEEEDKNQFSLSPGYGFGFALFKKCLIFINRRLIEDTDSVYFKEQIELRFLTWRTKIIEEFLQTAINFQKKEVIDVYSVNNNGTSKACSKPYRNFNSVFINEKTKKQLKESVRWFIDNKKWYRDRGIPYKMGIMLYGIPGTGKTSLIHALATYLERNIYLVRPSRLSSMRSIDIGSSIVLLEDIDTDNVVNVRDDDDDEPEVASDNSVTKYKNRKKEPITLGDNLGDILNYFDGFKTPDGIIFIMTTNHLEKLDKALFRRGRIDLLLEIGKMDYESFKNMYEAFFSEKLNLKKKDYIPVTGAAAQSIFMSSSNHSEALENYKNNN